MKKVKRKNKQETWTAKKPTADELWRQIQSLQNRLDQRDQLLGEIFALNKREGSEWNHIVARAEAMELKKPELRSCRPVDWYPLQTVVDLLKLNSTAWLANHEIKYLEIRIDTRDNQCLLYSGSRYPLEKQETGIVRKLLAHNEEELRAFFEERDERSKTFKDD